jgi:hypothetical protein
VGGEKSEQKNANPEHFWVLFRICIFLVSSWKCKSGTCPGHCSYPPRAILPVCKRATVNLALWDLRRRVCDLINVNSLS